MCFIQYPPLWKNGTGLADQEESIRSVEAALIEAQEEKRVYEDTLQEPPEEEFPF